MIMRVLILYSRSITVKIAGARVVAGEKCFLEIFRKVLEKISANIFHFFVLRVAESASVCL